MPAELSEVCISHSAADIKTYLITELSKSLEVDPSTIDPAAPLETLGVDSLMALGMAGGLAAWLDRDVPATLMWDYRSINAIAEGLATSKTAASLPAGVVALQPEGDRPPIFCFPGLAGSPIAFIHLATKMEPDQPIYGIAIPGFQGVPDIDEVPGRFTTVEDIAPAMLQMIRQVRPTGPYLLAGYCFGGLLAFEVAQQLVTSGEKVSMLAIYDAFTPTGRVPRPGWQRFFVHLWLLTTGQRHIRDLLGNLRWNQLQKRLRTAEPQYWIEPAPLDIDPGKSLWNRNSRAAANYTPRTDSLYPGSIVWFQATERAIYNRFYKLMICGGWSKVARDGVTTVPIPGNHGDLIGPKHAEYAANALRDFIPVPAH